MIRNSFFLFTMALMAVLLHVNTACASTIVFSDNFDNAINGNGQATTFANLNPTVGSWTPQSTGGGFNDHDDFGEIIGNGIGIASTNNALVIDTGEDSQGSDGLGSTDSNAILEGNFTKSFDLANPNTSFNFGWDWYGTRLAGNTNENQRNMRLSLNEGNARRFVMVLELHNGSTIEIAMNDGIGNLDDNIVLTVPRPSSSRADGSYDPNFNTHMNVSIDETGLISVTATAPDGTTNTVAGIWNNAGNIAPSQLDGFELFLGGSNGGNKGGTFDNFVATVVPEPSSYALVLGLLMACVVIRSNRLR